MTHQRKSPLRCVDCTRATRKPATHVSGNYENKSRACDGGWAGEAYCEEHAKDHPDAIPDPCLE